MRKKIEQSGRDARWEFDRKKLFERTEYVSQICSDIYNVAQVSECVCVCVSMYTLSISVLLYSIMYSVHVYV